MLRSIFPLLLLAGISAADPGKPAPLKKGDLTFSVEDSPETTLVTGHFADSRNITFRIDWLNQTPPPKEFSVKIEHGISESTHLLGSTHITRTILASEKDDAIFIHFLADKPGDLAFRATLVPPAGKGEITIEDRRELVWNPDETPEKARAWVIPFESDVESEGSAIVLRGEGECLLILNFADRDSNEKPLADTWKRLANSHDPGSNPPDPTKIWQSVFDKATQR